MNRIVISLLVFAFAACAQAQQFKWVDKDGRVRYGDVPPAGVKATPLKPPPGPAVQPGASSKDGKAAKDGKGAKDTKKTGPLTAKEQEEEFRKRQAEQKKAEEKAALEEKERAANKQNCDNARTQLRELESGQRIARTNEKGERVFLEDDQRARDTAAARKAVAEWCK